MKKSIFLLLFLFSVTYGNKLSVFSSYEKALKIAKSENKKLLMFVYSDSCKWCKKMKETTFKNDEVAGFINNRYIFLVQHKEKGTYSKKLFYPRFIPTTFLVEPKTLDEIYALYGYKAPKQLINELLEF